MLFDDAEQGRTADRAGQISIGQIRADDGLAKSGCNLGFNDSAVQFTSVIGKWRVVLCADLHNKINLS